MGWRRVYNNDEVTDIGLTRKQVHEARIARDAEEAGYIVGLNDRSAAAAA
jgi:hypothetical protein